MIEALEGFVMSMVWLGVGAFVFLAGMLVWAFVDIYKLKAESELKKAIEKELEKTRKES